VKKILLTALTLALVIGGATAVFAAVDNQPAPTLTSTAEDVSGPCDEAEHANDPRCAGGTGRHHETAGDDRRHVQDDDADEAREVEVGEDVPGPCDEAEHASDPRCATGVPAGQAGEDQDADDDQEAVDDDPGEVDNSGPGSVNSGPGSAHSGPSGEAEDHGGESGHSGPGGGGEGDDD
jgi:hypothetical protein